MPVVSHHVQMLVCYTVGSRKRTGLLGWPKSSPAGEAGIPKRLIEMLWVFLAATQPVCCFLVFCYRRQGSCPGLLLRGEKGLPWCMLLSLYRASFILLVSYPYHPRLLFLRGQLSAPLSLFSRVSGLRRVFHSSRHVRGDGAVGPHQWPHSSTTGPDEADTVAHRDGNLSAGREGNDWQRGRGCSHRLAD